MSEAARWALEAVGVSKRYGRGALALDNVSLAVPAGVLAALVGPNAAGKSTLIKTWVGFERPSTGTVRCQGVDPGGRGSERSRVSPMFLSNPTCIGH